MHIQIIKIIKKKKETQHKDNSKAGHLVDYRADLLNLRTAHKLKLPHHTTHKPGETTTELLLQYQHQDWMLEE
jgi:hypothetical protein